MARAATAPPEPTAIPWPLVLKPSADAFVDQREPNKNYGGFSQIDLQDDPRLRGFVQFEVRDLPPGVAARALLRLHVANGSDDDPAGIKVFATGAPWDEKTITWNNQPQPGAQVAVVDPAPLTEGQTVEIDLGPIVRDNGVYDFVLTS